MISCNQCDIQVVRVIQLLCSTVFHVETGVQVAFFPHQNLMIQCNGGVLLMIVPELAFFLNTVSHKKPMDVELVSFSGKCVT